MNDTIEPRKRNQRPLDPIMEAHWVNQRIERVRNRTLDHITKLQRGCAEIEATILEDTSPAARRILDALLEPDAAVELPSPRNSDAPPAELDIPPVLRDDRRVPKR
jgi:hypothetical protein